MSELTKTLSFRSADMAVRARGWGTGASGWSSRRFAGDSRRPGVDPAILGAGRLPFTADQETSRGLAADQRSDRSSHPHHRTTKLARLEAVLFLAREPIHSRKLSQFANLADGTEARTLAKQLNDIYDSAGQSFRIYEVAGGFQLRTRSKFAPWLRRLRHAPVDVRLSAPAMETLAVVAYRQPVVRAEIEAVRGVACGEVIRQLMEREMVKVAGRSSELGRPFLYCTTSHFLELFGLSSLEELPRADIFRHGSDRSQGSESNCHKIDHGVSDEGEIEVKLMHGQSSETFESLNRLMVAGGPPQALLADRTPADVIKAWDDDADELVDDEVDDDDDDDLDDDDDDDDEEGEWEDVDDDEEEDDDYEYEYEDDDDEDDDDEEEEEDAPDEEEEEDEWEEVDDEDDEDEEDDLDDDDDDDDWDDDDDDWEEDD